MVLLLVRFESYRVTTLFKIQSDEPLYIDPLSEEGAKPDRTTGAVSFKGIFFAYPTRPTVQVHAY